MYAHIPDAVAEPCEAQPMKLIHIDAVCQKNSLGLGIAIVRLGQRG